eukprot:127488-Rhodomonas_salina.2
MHGAIAFSEGQTEQSCSKQPAATKDQVHSFAQCATVSFSTPPTSPPSSPRRQFCVDWRVPPKAPIRKTRIRKSIYWEQDAEMKASGSWRKSLHLDWKHLDFQARVDAIFACKFQRLEELAALDAALSLND